MAAWTELGIGGGGLTAVLTGFKLTGAPPAHDGLYSSFSYTSGRERSVAHMPLPDAHDGDGDGGGGWRMQLACRANTCTAAVPLPAV